MVGHKSSKTRQRKGQDEDYRLSQDLRFASPAHERDENTDCLQLDSATKRSKKQTTFGSGHRSTVAASSHAWPEVKVPALGEIQGILEGIYHSNIFAIAPFSRKSSRKTPNRNSRGNLISQRAGTAGTGGTLSLREWHELLENHGLVPHHLSKVDAIHVFSNSRRSNLSIKYQSQGSKMNELRIALRVLATHLDVPLSNMPLPVWLSHVSTPPLNALCYSPSPHKKATRC